MAWDKLLNREDCIQKVMEAKVRSMQPEYKGCAVYVVYNAKYDRFHIDYFTDSGTVRTLVNGEVWE